MNFFGKKDIPESVLPVFEKDDYICYVRVYYRGGRYSSRLFFKGAANGTIEEITKATLEGQKRFTDSLREATSTVCEELFEGNNPEGVWQFFDFCEKNGFDETEDGYIGYTYLAHSAFQIVVSKHDGYFCRVYVYER